LNTEASFSSAFPTFYYFFFAFDCLTLALYYFTFCYCFFSFGDLFFTLSNSFLSFGDLFFTLSNSFLSFGDDGLLLCLSLIKSHVLLLWKLLFDALSLI